VKLSDNNNTEYEGRLNGKATNHGKLLVTLESKFSCGSIRVVSEKEEDPIDFDKKNGVKLSGDNNKYGICWTAQW
jgi:hypothetical protein